MIRTALALIATGLVALSAPASATVQGMDTGNGLLFNCTQNPGSFGSGLCLGFIEGIVNADDLERWMKSPHSYLCEMPQVTNGQKLDVIVRYLTDHPETRHYHGAGLALRALQLAFCKPTGN